MIFCNFWVLFEKYFLFSGIETNFSKLNFNFVTNQLSNIVGILQQTQKF